MFHVSFSLFAKTGTWKEFNSIQWVQPNIQAMRLPKRENAR